jgi:hypothetical protein
MCAKFQEILFRQRLLTQLLINDAYSRRNTLLVK